MSETTRLTALIIIADRTKRDSLDQPLRQAGLRIRHATVKRDSAWR